MKAKIILSLLALGCPSWATAANVIPDHLKPLPLTTEQQVKIEALLRVDPNSIDPYEHRPGGRTTVTRLNTSDAFSLNLANLSFEEQGLFKVGNGLFKKLWVSAPASTNASDGLGPLFNARSCQHCHLKDGRSQPPSNDEPIASSLVLRLGDATGDPDPTYGNQIQTSSTQNLKPEATVGQLYTPLLVEYPDGQSQVLNRPEYKITELHYGKLSKTTQLSGRTAPAMIGLGLLEAIPDDRLLSLADPDDLDGDGISGRINWTHSQVTGKTGIGRFNWKASAVTLRDQAVDAFKADLGLSTLEHPDHYGDCSAQQRQCRLQASGGDPEVSDDMVRWVTFYSRSLGVPERNNVASVLPGKRLFHATGCGSCHTPSHVTAKLADTDELSLNLIYPYTDLLLHDMGPGLADGIAAGSATASEWRTAPLWGIGLLPQVNGHQQLLHDGRARGVEEAILWHGGEAQASREAFKRLSGSERNQLIEFVNSL